MFKGEVTFECDSSNADVKWSRIFCFAISSRNVSYAGVFTLFQINADHVAIDCVIVIICSTGTVDVSYDLTVHSNAGDCRNDRTAEGRCDSSVFKNNDSFAITDGNQAIRDIK